MSVATQEPQSEETVIEEQDVKNSKMPEWLPAVIVLVVMFAWFGFVGCSIVGWHLDIAEKAKALNELIATLPKK